MAKLKIIVALIGIAVFAWIISSIDVSKLFSIISNADFLLLGLALLIVLFTVLLKGLKWGLLLRPFGKKLAVLDCSRIFLIGFFLSVLTPGRVGDLARALYLKDRMKFGQALSTVILDRLVDLTVLFFSGILAAIAFSLVFKQQVISLPLAVIFIAFFALALFLVSRQKLMRFILRPFFNLFIPASLKPKASESFASFFEALRIFAKKPFTLLAVFLLSIAAIFLSSIAFWLIALALGLKIGFALALIAVPIIALADLLPITVSGIGARELLLIFMFSFASVSAESAVAVSIVYFIIGYISVALAGFAFFLKEPVKLNFSA